MYIFYAFRNIINENSFQKWILSLLIFTLFFCLLYLTRIWFLEKYKKASFSKSGAHFTGIFNKTKIYFIFIVSLYISSKVLTLPEILSFSIARLSLFVFLFQFGIWGNQLICSLVGDCLIGKQNNKTSSFFINIVFKTILWSLLILLALDNLGVNITTLIGGLGIGGIAVALAVQNILGDLLASLSIVIDKPFEVGDFIVINEFSGTVENTGLKTTRIKSLSGEQLIFSNSDLLKSVIRNFKRMNERRVVLNLDVSYETPVDKLERIPSLIKKIIETQDTIKFDRAHFSCFKSYSLNYEIVYWILDQDYNVYMDAQQFINLEIFKMFNAEKIEFAYPTQKILVSK